MLHCSNWCYDAPVTAVSHWRWTLLFIPGKDTELIGVHQKDHKLLLLLIASIRPDECDDVLNLCTLQLSTELESLLSASLLTVGLRLTPNFSYSSNVERSFIIMFCGLCWHLYKAARLIYSQWKLCTWCFFVFFLVTFFDLLMRFVKHVLFLWNTFLCDLPLWKVL